MTFKLDRPRNLSVEVNGDIFHNLHLFANPIDEKKPKKLKDKNNLIRQCLGFENIWIDRFQTRTKLVNLRIFYNEKYCKAPGRGIENVLFKDISYTGENAEVSMIIGYDKERKVKTFVLKTCK